MRCPQCHQENPAGARFCNGCGTRLEMTCPACGHVNPTGSRFCNGCGNTLDAQTPAGVETRFASPQSYTPKHLAEKILTSKGVLEGERKQVTVLFCDLVGSTALAERIGAEAMHGVINKFFTLALAEVHLYEGTVNQFLGDGFMALFGAPIAHEDHAQRAILAAVGLQRAMRERSTDLGLPQGESVAIRMGLNTGMVVVGAIGDNLRMDYTAVGDTTNLAARLQQVADPGAVLLSESTVRLALDFVQVEPLGAIEVKGKSGPVHAYRLIGRVSRRSPLAGRVDHPLSPLAGRHRELLAVQDLLSEVESGRGQVVGLVGEPGVGKSRLLYEFRQHLTDRNVTYLEGRCLSYGGTIPYLPILDIVRANCGIGDMDTPGVIGDKVRWSLQELGLDVDKYAPHLVDLLGVKEGAEPLSVLTAEAIKDQTFSVLREMSMRGSQQRPLIFGVEDLHWVDRTSAEYLSFLVEGIASASILVLCTYRPGYRPPWIDKSYATQIGIRALSPADSFALVRSIVEDENVLSGVAPAILGKAEGNPFFLEELCRGARDHLDLQHPPAVPDTVQDMLMARIDRLPGDAKRLLQTAAVLGREAPLPLLTALWQDGGLEHHLAELKRQEFLFERTQSGHNPAYVFKHVLTREVAYGSLLTGQRQLLHAAAGRALETLYSDRLEQVYDRLAYHYAESTDAIKAVDYLSRLAEKAGRGYAHTEALSALEMAVAHVPRLPVELQEHRFFELLNQRGESLFYLGHFQDLLHLFSPHEERLVQLSDPSLASDYYFWFASACSFVGDRERAARHAHRALEEATRGGGRVQIGRAHVVLSLEYYFSGQIGQAIAHGRHAVALLDGTAEQALRGMAYQYLGIAYLIASEFDLALESATQADSISQAIGDRRIRARAAQVSAFVHISKGDWEQAIDTSEGALKYSPDGFETAAILGALGAAHLERGDARKACEILEKAVAEALRFRSRQVQANWKFFLAEAYRLNGQLHEARAAARDALDISKDAAFPLGVGVAQLSLGRLAQSVGALDDAHMHLDEALQTLTAIRARYWVARAHLDLASLAGARHDRVTAVRQLQGAHALFTAMHVPRYVERTEQLARELGLSLGEPASTPPDMRND
jgi:class 3 adenylate cyclase/tetratricopeptide (TPR) repeat protein